MFGISILASFLTISAPLELSLSMISIKHEHLSICSENWSSNLCSHRNDSESEAMIGYNKLVCKPSRYGTSYKVNGFVQQLQFKRTCLEEHFSEFNISSKRLHPQSHVVTSLKGKSHRETRVPIMHLGLVFPIHLRNSRVIFYKIYHGWCGLGW